MGSFVEYRHHYLDGDNVFEFAISIVQLLKKVGSSDSNIVCLPELWYAKIVTNFETEFDKIIDVAKEYNMVIIPGAFIERSSNNNGNDLQSLLL